MRLLRYLVSGVSLFWADLRRDVSLRVTFVIAVSAFVLSLFAFVASTGLLIQIP